MVGIAALGTAVGSFSKGYMEGEKHRSEMEDSEQRRALGKIQLDEAKRKADSRTEMDSIIKEYEPFLSGKADSAPAAAPAPSAGGIAAPGQAALNPEVNPDSATSIPSGPSTAVGGASGPDAVPTKAGISAPGAAPAPAAAPVNPWEKRQELYSRLNLAALKQASSPQELQAAMQSSLSMMKNFRDAQMDEKLAAMQDFMINRDPTRATQMLRQAGVELKDGATWEVRQVPIIPGSKAMTDDVFITSPDGKNTTSMNTLLMHRMKPEDLFKSKIEVAKAINEASYHEAIIQNAKAGLANARTQTDIMKRSADLADKKFNFEAVQTMNTKAQAQSDRLAGVPRELTPKELIEMDPKDVDAYNAKRAANMGRSNAVMVTFGLNNEMASDGKELLPVAIADKATMMAAQQARDPSKDYVKIDQTNGRSYVMVDNRKVWVMPLAKPQDPAKPAAPAQSSGVTPPGGAPAAAAPAAPAEPVQARAPVADPGPQPVRDGNEDFNSFKNRMISWDTQRQAFAAQQANAASEQERQRRLAARGGNMGINRPLIQSGNGPVQPGVQTSWTPGPYGQPPARPDPNAPSIYADPYAWAQYRQQGR